MSSTPATALTPSAPPIPAVHRRVVLVPWGGNEPDGARRAAGLFDAAGNHLAAGECLRYDGAPITLQPEYDPLAPVQDLPGRYLFGGLLYGHFGHFLCESTGRLWALDQGGFDGVIWYPKLRLGHPAKLTKPYAPFFAALGFAGLSLIAPQAPLRVGELVIPAQGFGIGTLSAGTPEYRQFMRSHLGATIAPEGGEKLYISRSGLPVKRGSMLLETRIEALMRAEGYEVFHPQDHPIATQIARYKAARWIVALDGSALHLAGMIVSPEAQVAIINRGPSQNIDDYLRQFRHFVGLEPVRIDAVRRYWFPAGRRVVKRETHALADFPTLGAGLHQAGFIASIAGWQNPDAEAIAAAVADRADRCGAPLHEYAAGGVA